MLLTYREAARRAGVDVRTVRRWRASGMPSVVGDGGAVLFDLEELLEWKRYMAFMNPAHTIPTRRRST